MYTVFFNMDWCPSSAFVSLSHIHALYWQVYQFVGGCKTGDVSWVCATIESGVDVSIILPHEVKICICTCSCGIDILKVYLWCVSMYNNCYVIANVCGKHVAQLQCSGRTSLDSISMHLEILISNTYLVQPNADLYKVHKNLVKNVSWPFLLALTNM